MVQAVKYQSTTVKVDKTLGELGELIRNYGGSRFEQIWNDDGGTMGIRFAIRHPQIGELPVTMTQKTGEIERILRANGYKKSASSKEVREQAERIAWRHTKDLTEQLLLAVKLGQRSLPGAFMADIEVSDGSSEASVTLEEWFSSRAAISAGGRVELLQSDNVIALPEADTR